MSIKVHVTITTNTAKLALPSTPPNHNYPPGGVLYLQQPGRLKNNNKKVARYPPIALDLVDRCPSRLKKALQHGLLT